MWSIITIVNKIFYDNLDHSNFLGFTWERAFKGKTPIGIDTNDVDFNVIGKTGGEKKHTLTISEMPSHNHSTDGYITTNPLGGLDGFIYYGQPSGTTKQQLSTNFNGGNQSHNNLQPYEVASYWRRIS